MNGVLIDDMAYHREAYLEFAKRYGKTFTVKEFDDLFTGRKNSEILTYLFGRELSPDELARLEDEKESLYRDRYREKRQLLPGLLDLLEALRETGVPCAVATSAPRANADFILDGLNIRKFFARVVDAGMVKNGKPDPEIYLQAAKAVNTAPSHCVVFEDAIGGVLAGRRAGAKVVGITTTQPPEKLSNAHRIIPDFRDITVENLRELIAEKDVPFSDGNELDLPSEAAR